MNEKDRRPCWYLDLELSASRTMQNKFLLSYIYICQIYVYMREREGNRNLFLMILERTMRNKLDIKRSS